MVMAIIFSIALATVIVVIGSIIYLLKQGRLGQGGKDNSPVKVDEPLIKKEISPIYNNPETLRRRVNLDKPSPETEMPTIVKESDNLDVDRLNMEDQRDKLKELIESEFGLLDKLRSCGALTRVKIAEVNSVTTLYKKNEYILGEILSENRHQDLMKALSDCGQHHVVNWVKGNGKYKEEFGFDWPLRETEEKVLDCNQEALVDLLNADELLPKLHAVGVINKRQRDSIGSESTEYKRSEALLDAVRRFSLKSYFAFKECLRQSGQSHVVDTLESGGVIAPVHATLECENLDDVETRIVTQMADVLVGKSPMEADRLLAALQLKVIAVRRGKSIVSYISCNKEEEFNHLSKIIDNLKMRNILEQLFNLLIPNAKIKVLSVNLSSEDYEKAKQIFKGSTRKCVKCSVQTAYARELPCKHVICPDCVQGLVKDNAREYGIECPRCKSPFTVTVVPQERRQQEQNKYVKDEYSVEMKEDRSPFWMKSKVRGMAIMDNNIFVVCNQPPNVIFKFGLGESDRAMPVELSISGMGLARGMAASDNHSYLYITDWSETSEGKLWRYKYKRGEETRVNGPVAVLDVQPFGVSVSPKNDEVLVTCATQVDVSRERGRIYIYKQSGDELHKIRTIDVPDVEMPRHAILTASSQFIVCHGLSSMARHGVTSFEEGGDGVLIAKRFYGRDSVGGGAGENEVNCPLSLTIDRNRMILVVDSKNNRIQLLTEDLQLVRHLLTNEEHGIEYPRHVCQDPSTGRLYVGQEDGKVRTFN